MIATKTIELNTQTLKSKRIDFLYRLGTELPLPIVILLTLPLWIVTALFDNAFLGDIAASVGLSICALWFWNMLKSQNDMLRFMRLGAVILCIVQFTSWLTSSYAHHSEGMDMDASLQTYLGFDSAVSYYATAICYVILFAFFFSLMGSLKMIQTLELQIIEKVLRIKSIDKKVLYVAIFILVGSEFLLFASGIVGQRSIVLEGYAEGEKPFWYFFYETCLSIHVLLNALLVYKIMNGEIQNKRIAFMILGGSFLILALLFFNKGRSGFVFYLISFVYWYIFISNKRPSIVKTLLVIAIVYPIVSQILLFNNFIRSANANLEDSRGSAIDVLPQAFDTYTGAGDLIEEERGRSSRNLATRPLVAQPLAQCIHLESGSKRFTYGDNLTHSFIWVMPAVIAPFKNEYATQEVLLYQHFPIGYKDIADSLYLYSYADFGWFGILVYPLVFVLIWILFLYLFFVLNPSVLSYLALATIFFQLFLLGIAESSVITWLLGFRSVLIFIVVDFIVFMPLFSWKRKQKQLKINAKLL